MPASPAAASRPALSLVARLCNAMAVSGDETQVRQIVLDELQPPQENMKIDALGNLLITRPGRGRRRLRVMIDAHMDEVGLMLVAESGDGLYEFRPVSSMKARVFAGKQIVVGRRLLPGIVGTKAIHLLTDEDLAKHLADDSLRVDLGPGGKAAVGDRGTFAPNFQRIGPSIMSKALDDRLGVAILIELARRTWPDIDLLAAFTVQEEMGLRGAQVAASYFNPDLAIVIDATPAHDLPMQRAGENTFYNTRLGHGPAIYVSNREAIDDPRLVRFLEETARRARIPYQIRQPGGGGTDAGAIQRALDGIPVVSVSVPHRYPHSAVSVARVDDLRHTYALLEAALRRLSPDVLKAGRPARRPAQRKR